MEQLKPPNSLSFEGNVAENWRTWVQKFDLYLIASDMAEKSEERQCATFLHVAGDEALKVYNTLECADRKLDLDVLKESFRKYCEPRKNVTYLRHIFFTRAQGQNETIDAYVTDLKIKAKDCEFGTLTDELIKDRIVCGVNNDIVRARLLRDEKLDLEKALDICRANESTQSHMKALQEESDIAVNKITKTRPRAKQDSMHMKSARKDGEECTRCGYTHEPKKCPAYGKVCNECSRINHFGRVCRTPRQKDNSKKTERKVYELEQEGNAEMYLGCIEIKENVPTKRLDVVSANEKENQKWTQALTINNHAVTFKPQEQSAMYCRTRNMRK